MTWPMRCRCLRCGSCRVREQITSGLCSADAPFNGPGIQEPAALPAVANVVRTLGPTSPTRQPSSPSDSQHQPLGRRASLWGSPSRLPASRMRRRPLLLMFTGYRRRDLASIPRSPQCPVRSPVPGPAPDAAGCTRNAKARNASAAFARRGSPNQPMFAQKPVSLPRPGNGSHVAHSSTHFGQEPAAAGRSQW